MAFFTTIAKEDMDTSTDGAPDIDAMNDADLAIAEGTDISDAAADDIEVANEELDDASDALDGLNDVGDHIQDSIDSGEGMTEREAEGMEIAVEQIARRLGIRQTKRFMPAKESFGGRNDRLRASKVAKEGVMDFIKKVWEGILKFIRMIRDKVKQFFFGMTKNIEGLMTMSAELKKQVNNMSAGMKFDRGELDNISVAEAFSHETKADKESATKIIKAVVDLSNTGKVYAGEKSKNKDTIDKLVSAINESNRDNDEKLIADLEAAISKEYDSKKHIASQIKSSLSGLTGTSESDVKGLPEALKGKVDVYGPFTNSRVLVVTKEVTITETGKRLLAKLVAIDPKNLKESQVKAKSTLEERESGIALTVKFETLSKQEARTITALKDKGEMLDIIKEVDALLAKLDAQKDNGKLAEKISETLDNTTEEILKNLKSSDKVTSAVKVALSSVEETIKEGNEAVKKVGSEFPSMGIQAAKKGLDYVRASLANMKEDK
jgi:hypothetical protein